MPVQALCPSCGHAFKLADSLVGQSVSCKKCGESFVLEAPADKTKPGSSRDQTKIQTKPPPIRAQKASSRDRDDEDDAEDQPRARDRDRKKEAPSRRGQRNPAEAGNSKMVLILGGIIAAVVVMGGALVVVLFLFFFLRSGPRNPPVNDQPPFAQVNPPDQNPLPRPLDPERKVPPPANFPKDRPGKDLPKVNPVVPNPPGQDPFLPKKDLIPAAVSWTVQPDPGPDMMVTPQDTKGSLALIGTPHFVYPRTPSPFVAVRHGQINKEGWQVLDLQKFKQVASVNGKLDLNNESLSPDGKFLAGKGKVQLNSTLIHVVSLADGRLIQSISLDTKAAGLHMIEFLEQGHLLTYKTHGLTGHYEVFNIATGQPTTRFTVQGLLDARHNLALSPGRKYLAVAHDNQIDLFHPVRGEMVGQIRLPPGTGSFKALAFSPNGSQLACLIENFGSSSRLMCWKMTAAGELAIDHKFSKDVHTLVKNAFGYKGEILEWVPDNSGWLLYGQLWVDYQSGAPVYTIPYDPQEFRYWPRRLIGKDHVALAGGNFQAAQLAIVALPREVIAAAVKNARAGGGVAASELPAAKTSDLASAKSLPPPGGNIAWMVQPDPAANPKGRLAAQPIQLRTKPAEILHILFASGDVAQAAVLSSLTPNPLSPRKQFRVDRYDLASGKFLDGCELYSSDRADRPELRFPMPGMVKDSPLRADLSPDGSRLVVRKSTDAKRLDLWNLAEGKHLVGWLPYENAGNVDSFAFVGPDQVLTSGNGKLILWKVPECQALYVAEGYRGEFQLSAGRKYLLASTGTSLEILETASGERKGQLASPGGQAVQLLASAFRHDGAECAVALNQSSGIKMARWSLADGTLSGTCTANSGSQPMAFMGKQHLLQGDMLYDWKLKGALCFYHLPSGGVHGTGSPDGRHWFATTFQNNSLLTAQTLPDAGAASLAAVVAAGKLQPVITPGMAVQVNINAGQEKFRSAVQTQLNNLVQSQGYKTGPGGLTISVTAQASSTGKLLDYEIRKIGPGAGIGKQRIKVNEQQVVCQSQITDAQGTLISKNDSVFKTPDSLTIEGDNYEQQINDMMWNNAISWGSSIGLPTNMFRAQGQLLTLPKNSILTGGG